MFGKLIAATTAALALSAGIPLAAQNAGGTNFSPVPNYHLMQLEVDTSRVPAEEFAAKTSALRDCQQAKALAKELGASVKRNRFKRATTLPAALQDTLEEMPVGRATQVFGDGTKRARVIVLCGRG